MAEVDQRPVVGRTALRYGAGRALVALADDPLVEDADIADHEQPQVTHHVGRELLVGDLLAVDVEAEALALDAAAVGELDLEVELHATINRVDRVHP